MKRLVLALLCAACGSDSGTTTAPDAAPATIPDAAPVTVPDAAPATVADAAPATAADAATAPDAAPGSVVLQRCTGRAFPPQPAGDFRHVGSDIIALLSVEHAAEDVLTTERTAVVAGAKFQYGPTYKDLEDEDVHVWIDDCAGWQHVAEKTTNGDGRITTTFAPVPYGVYELRYVVEGDATTAPATLWVLPPGTHVTVFDIDGTLTTSDFEIVHDVFDDLASGDYVPEAYPSAAAMTRAYRGLGEIGVYITGRPYWLTKVSRQWLRDLDFAPGPLFLARSNAEALPTQGGVGTFKRELLERLVDDGFILDTAQGNATTDIYAYLGAGLAAAKVWIIGPHAGEMGTNAVTASWAAHTAAIAAWPTVHQPFE